MRKPVTNFNRYYDYYKTFEKYLPSEKVTKLISQHGSRIAKVSLPFIKLYEPIEKNLSVTADLLKVYSSINEIRNSEDLDFLTLGKPLIIVVVSIASVAGTIFLNPAGLIVTNFHDILISAYIINQAYRQENYLKIAKEALFFVKLIATFSPHIKITLISFKVLVSASSSIQGFVDGRWLEGSADLIMTAIKSQKMCRELKKSYYTSERDAALQIENVPA